MFTRCPDCRTILPLQVGELARARGQVRCGHCGSVFYAPEHLCESLSANGDFVAPHLSERPPTLVQSGANPERVTDDLFLSQQPTLEANADDDLLEPLDQPSSLLQRLDQKPPARTKRQWPWYCGVLLLTAAIGAQSLQRFSAQLMNAPPWRAWVEPACQWLRCSGMPQRALDKIRLVSRSVRPHPSVAGALIISATMQNQAGFEQRYPVIEIVLSDLSGRAIAMRRFQPSEYLEESAEIGGKMPAETLLPLVFEVVDPQGEAVAFEFAFR